VRDDKERTTKRTRHGRTTKDERGNIAREESDLG
jgi:hypothetical protein